MLIVGLTGGIGAGKSSVAKMFQELGVPVFNSDEQAKALYQRADLKEWLIQEFGAQLYQNDLFQRQELAKIIFNDSKALHKVNAKIHPMVAQTFKSWVAKQSSSYVIKEAAILIESGSYKSCDQIILVTAPEKVRLQRVVKRDGASETEVKARMDKQMPESEKMDYANFVIENLDLKLAENRVKEVHLQLCKLSLGFN